MCKLYILLSLFVDNFLLFPPDLDISVGLRFRCRYWFRDLEPKLQKKNTKRFFLNIEFEFPRTRLEKKLIKPGIHELHSVQKSASQKVNFAKMCWSLKNHKTLSNTQNYFFHYLILKSTYAAIGTAGWV